MRRLTNRQSRVLDYICRVATVRGTAPTYREIAAEFGYRSPKAAVDHVERLAEKGYVRVHRGRSRGIEVLVGSTDNEQDIVTVPLLGGIAAGRPTEAAETWSEQVRVDRTVLGRASSGRLFALRVTGDSMNGRGIYDGDIAIAQADASPRIGDVVVALIDHESTLKTLARGADGIFLRSENPRHPDLFPVTEMAIQGVVCALIRKVG